MEAQCASYSPIGYCGAAAQQQSGAQQDRTMRFATALPSFLISAESWPATAAQYSAARGDSTARTGSLELAQWVQRRFRRGAPAGHGLSAEQGREDLQVLPRDVERQVLRVDHALDKAQLRTHSEWHARAAPGRLQCRANPITRAALKVQCVTR